MPAQRYQVFVYGTLLVPDIMREVTGRQYAGRPATLWGFRRYRLRGCSYPGIVPRADSHVEGMVFEVGPVALAALDRYEDPCYERRTVEVETVAGPVQAYAYVIPEDRRHLLEARDWDLDYWRRCQRRLGQ